MTVKSKDNVVETMGLPLEQSKELRKQLKTGWVGEMWLDSSPGDVCIPMEQSDKTV